MPRSGVPSRWLAGIGLTALAVRVAGAAVRPPWHDEYFTAWVAGLPWHEMLAALRLDSGPPLLYAMTKLLVLAGVPPLAGARALAVAAGTLAAVLGTVAASRAFGPRAATWCGLLLALHPLAVAWSCEGRAYALILLAAAWGWERLEAIAANERGQIGLAAAVAFACWSHAFGLVLAGALAVAALTLERGRRRGALAAIAAGVASNLPWVPVAMTQPAAATAWMTQAWNALPTFEKIVAPARLLPPLAPAGERLDLPTAPVVAQVLAALACLALLAISSTAARPWLLLALPAGGLTALAWLGVPAFYPGRGEALFLLPFLALVAAGAARVRAGTLVALGLVLGAAATSGAAIARWASAPPSGEAVLARALRRDMPAGGTVVIGGYWRLGIAYHLGADAARFALVNVPAEAGHHPGWYDPETDRPMPGEVERLHQDLMRTAGRAAVLLSPGLATEPELRRLAEALGLNEVVRVPGAELLLPAPARRLP